VRPNPEIVAFKPNPVVYKFLVIQGGVITTNTTQNLNPSSVLVNYRRTYSSVNTVNFKSLARQRKALPINNYFSRATTYTSTPWKQTVIGTRLGDGKVDYLSTETYSTAFYPINYQPLPSHVADAADKALRKMSKEASGLSVNLAEAFAERSQTARMMSDTVWRVARAARALRKGDLYSVYNELSMSKGLSRHQERRIIKTDPSKRLANWWLELQYGWKPLLQDVHDAAELLAKHIETDPWHSELKAQAQATQIVHDFNKEDANVSSGIEQNTTSARYHLFLSLDSASRSILSQTGISNPLLLGWELLPYSFVVDWFIPVGNYLESLGNFDGWTFHSGTLTQKTVLKYDRSYGKSVRTKSDRYYDIGTSGGVSAKGFYFQRTKLSGFPTAQFPRLKTLDQALSPLHFANGLALLRSAFRK
jgi:hypothetical protein